MKKKVVKDSVLNERADRLTPAKRSAHMAKVRAKGNRSTELRVAAKLIREGIRGWKRHPPHIPGCPDFYFPLDRIVLFVDGCFWHGCPKCKRNMPRTRQQFWLDKINGNRRRDARIGRTLRSEGLIVLRIWEHALSDGRWLTRLLMHLNAARLPSRARLRPAVRQLPRPK